MELLHCIGKWLKDRRPSSANNGFCSFFLVQVNFTVESHPSRKNGANEDCTFDGGFRAREEKGEEEERGERKCMRMVSTATITG